MSKLIDITLGQIKINAGIDAEDFKEPMCGNCLHYCWSIDGDRHKGNCNNPYCVDKACMTLPAGLHAMTGSNLCSDYLNNFEKNEFITKIRVNITKEIIYEDIT